MRRLKIPKQSVAERIADLVQRAKSYSHGTRARYNADHCRCFQCRLANSRYKSQRQPNPLVSSTPAREHIRRLAHKGVGYKSVAAAASTSATIVWQIRNGLRPRIRQKTLDRILATDVAAASGHSLIDSKPTWRLIDELVGRGFTKSQIAKWMDYAPRASGADYAIQFKRGKPITAANAARVRKVYELLKAGKLRRD